MTCWVERALFERAVEGCGQEGVRSRPFDWTERPTTPSAGRRRCYGPPLPLAATICHPRATARALTCSLSVTVAAHATMPMSLPRPLRLEPSPLRLESLALNLDRLALRLEALELSTPNRVSRP